MAGRCLMRRGVRTFWCIVISCAAFAASARAVDVKLTSIREEMHVVTYFVIEDSAERAYEEYPFVKSFIIELLDKDGRVRGSKTFKVRKSELIKLDGGGYKTEPFLHTFIRDTGKGGTNTLRVAE
jgi:hypothetical protein